MTEMEYDYINALASGSRKRPTSYDAIHPIQNPDCGVLHYTVPVQMERPICETIPNCRTIVKRKLVTAKNQT